MKNIFFSFLFFSFLFEYRVINAVTQTNYDFSYSINTLNPNDVILNNLLGMVWRPNHDSIYDNFGKLGVYFWGIPSSFSQCSISENGSVVKNMEWANSKVDVGIKDGTEKWSPECNGFEGLSYFRFLQEKKGGIGMYTHAGVGNDLSETFWRTEFLRDISEIHMNFGFKPYRLTNNQVQTMPWKNSDFMRIISEQGLKKAKLTPKGTTYSSVQQEIIISMLNLHCRESTNNLCQIQLLFNIAYRDTNGKKFTSSEVFGDTNQGGIPVIFGFLNKGVTKMKCPGSGCLREVWTSLKSKTQDKSWLGIKRFEINISWVQFQNSLITASEEQNTQVSSLFGEKYNDKGEWILTGVDMAQEIVNRDLNKQVFIGGKVESLHVLSYLSFDVNDDSVINSLDLITTINNIFNLQNTKADINKDGTVNVLDVIGMINLIANGGNNFNRVRLKNYPELNHIITKYYLPKIREKNELKKLYSAIEIY